ncbi:MAG TPA: pectate lyase precursor [Polyangiaceae bacterium]
MHRHWALALSLAALIAGCSGDGEGDDAGGGGRGGTRTGGSGGSAGGGRGGTTGGTMPNESGGTAGASGRGSGKAGTSGASGSGTGEGAAAGATGEAGDGTGGVESGGTSGSGNAAGSAGSAGQSGEVRAFPGAEGFGAMVSGGRGGRVIKVTTLDATGPGSLQAALDEEGPRIIVFEVSGVIEADIIEITSGDVTIAGQTAPGGGITIAGRLYGAYDDSVGNIIIRHVRVRPVYDGSDGEQFDGIQLSLNHHFILDHVSVGFGVDETVDLYEATDATIQWSTIESSATEGHPEGEHNYGLINGPDGVRLSVHHNLFAHHRNRAPAIANGPAEVRNNVVYNMRTAFVHNNPASGSFNLVGNYFRTGDSDTLIPFYFDDENGSAADDLAYFLSGNVLDGTNSDCPAGSVDDPWTQCDYDPGRDASFVAANEGDFSSSSDDFRPVATTSAEDAFDAVLERAGAFPRDVVTQRSVEETQAGTGDWGSRIPGDLFAGLVAETPPADEDDDGMADAWESERGLDPSDGGDHSTVMASGYTAIEEYVNGLADALVR